MSWLKKVDKNNKFFHQMANMRAKSIYIGRIRRSARLLERQLEIKEEVGHFFENLYKGDFEAKPKLEGHSLLFLWMFMIRKKV